MTLRLRDIVRGSAVEDAVIEHDIQRDGESDLDVAIRLSDVVFQDCQFVNIRAPGAVFVNSQFTSCSFRSCDLSNAAWPESSIRDSVFASSKLTGSDFSVASWSAFSAASPNRFEECDLSYANFVSAITGKVVFARSRMTDTAFGMADLTGAAFDDCELANADFLHAILERCDFTTAHNFSIDPRSVRLRGARFSKHGLAGLVQSLGISIE